MIAVRRDKRDWVDKAQIIGTMVLVPLIGIAAKYANAQAEWATGIERRIGDNETAIKMIVLDRSRDAGNASAVASKLDKLTEQNGDAHVLLLQRLTAIETQLKLLPR